MQIDYVCHLIFPQGLYHYIDYGGHLIAPLGLYHHKRLGKGQV